jgi:hypothetical protein
VSSNHQSDLEISDELTVTGNVNGRITVLGGGVLVLLGVATGGVVVAGGGFARISGTTGGLFVAAGGHAVLAGTCEGSVTNDGGDLVIEGTVTEAVIEQAGTTSIAEGPSSADSARPDSPDNCASGRNCDTWADQPTGTRWTSPSPGWWVRCFVSLHGCGFTPLAPLAQGKHLAWHQSPRRDLQTGVWEYPTQRGYGAGKARVLGRAFRVDTYRGGQRITVDSARELVVVEGMIGVRR